MTTQAEKDFFKHFEVDSKDICQLVKADHCGKCPVPVMTDCNKEYYPELTAEKREALEELIMNNWQISYYKFQSATVIVVQNYDGIQLWEEKKSTRLDALLELCIQIDLDKEAVKKIVEG